MPELQPQVQFPGFPQALESLLKGVLRAAEAIRYDEAKNAGGRRVFSSCEEAVEGSGGGWEDSEVEAAEHAAAAGGWEAAGPSGSGSSPRRFDKVPVLLQILQPAGCGETHSPLRKEGQIRQVQTQF